MVQNSYELETIKEFKKVLKPKLFWPIWNTIICSGPPLNLIFRYFLERDIKKPTAAIILTVIAIVWITINWYWYVKARKDFKKNWQKISVELETLNFKEKPSKNYIETIFNSMQITAIVSLVAFFIFVASELFSKISYFKYFALFSISIFLLTAIGIIIVGIVLFFSFIKDAKKRGGLKNLLKRFFLIFTLLFIIQMIFILIMHKNPDWFICLLFSLLMTLPVIISTEVVIIYKEIKKEYLIIDSPDESDIK